MKAYKVKKSVAVLMYILAPAMILIFSAGIMALFAAEEKPPAVYWLLPVFVIMIAFMVVALVDTIRGRFVIDDDKVYTIGVFANRSLAFHEIKGYRLVDKFIFIEPRDSRQKRIRLSNTLESLDEIKAWLFERYPDLNTINFNEERETILNDQEFGSSEEHRDQNLKRAYKIARGVNIAGGLAAGWVFFIPEPYMYAVIAAIIMPIIALVVVVNFRGLIRVNQKPKSAYPSVFVAVFFPGLALALRAMLDISVFEYIGIWLPAALIGLVYTLIAVRATREFKFNVRSDIAGLIVIATIMFAYGYGTVVTLNCLFDTSEAQLYQANVVDKRINSGKNKSYHLKLTPWGTTPGSRGGLGC